MFVSLKMSSKCPCHEPSHYAPAEGLEPFAMVRFESKNKSRWLAASEGYYLKDKDAYLHLRSQPAPHPTFRSTGCLSFLWAPRPPHCRWKLFSWLNHLTSPWSVAAVLTAVKCPQHGSCCCCWVGTDGNLASSVPSLSCYLDRPTKCSQGNPSLGRSLRMFSTFYLPKSRVDFEKIMQRYLYHSVAFHMQKSKDTGMVCGSLRWKTVRFIYSKNGYHNHIWQLQVLLSTIRMVSRFSLQFCY